MGYSRGCEPLRVWNRLEPRARRKDFSRVLRAEVYDPQWLLARQWQFGEFKGEDTGSAIFAKLSMKSARLHAFREPQGAFSAYSDAVPLEARVERQPVPRDDHTRALLGRQWLKILDHHGQVFNQNGGNPEYEPAPWRGFFLKRFPLTASDPVGNSPQDVTARARQQAQARHRQHLAALSGRVVDGDAVARALPKGNFGWADLPDILKDDIDGAHRDFLLNAYRQLRAHIEELFHEPPGDDHRDDSGAWLPSQLEYQFSCRVQPEEGRELDLVAEEYPGGRLDWYAFEPGEQHKAEDPDLLPEVERQVFTVIPTPAEFPGQPNARFWELEDGAVDLGNLNADSTDLAKILIAEFALVYGNNWFVIPCRQPAGSLGEIEGIVVDDVFGQRTLVESAVKNNLPTSWTRWEMFSLSGRHGSGDLRHHLFLPPAVSGVMESEPVEAVRLVRDEMANSVWAVETRVADGLGGGRDGNEAARRFRQAILDQEPPAPASSPPEGVDLRYVLGNEVPENWIPFLPTHKPHENRAIRLQRASMPRFFQNTVHPIRPLNQILRAGLDSDDTQSEPFFIHEEEVSKAGLRVDTTFQRSRWYNGSTFVWFGHRKRTGRGQGSSGLRFDRVEHVKGET